MKNILWFILIPFIILASNDFKKEGLIILGVYALFYWLLRVDNKPPYSTQNNLSDYSFKKSASPNSVSKFERNQSNFENEINRQLNQIRGITTKIFWVGDEHRTHPWSKRPGGCTVVVIFKNENKDGNDCLGYDKVKRPYEYNAKITKKNFISYHISNFQFNDIESYINDIYIATENDVKLHHVWHSNMNMSLKEILSKYSTE